MYLDSMLWAVMCNVVHVLIFWFLIGTIQFILELTRYMTKQSWNERNTFNIIGKENLGQTNQRPGLLSTTVLNFLLSCLEWWKYITNKGRRPIVWNNNYNINTLFIYIVLLYIFTFTSIILNHLSIFHITKHWIHVTSKTTRKIRENLRGQMSKKSELLMLCTQSLN